MRALRLVAALMAFLFAGGASAAEPLLADLSQDVIAIHSGFTGAEVLLFGATDGAGDVVVVVRGPQTPVVVRRKDRVAGIWINTEEVTFEQVPGFYAVAASRPLDEITTPDIRIVHQLGPEHLRLPTRGGVRPSDERAFRDALIRNMEEIDLFSRQVQPVRFIGGQLFRTTVTFPANVPTGSYVVETFLLRDGMLVCSQSVALLVYKAGLEAAVFDFAYDRSWLYGLLAVVIALVAGWSADLVFRRA